MIRLKYSKAHKINISMVDAYNAGLSDTQIEKCIEKVTGVIGARNTRVYSSWEISVETSYFHKAGLESIVEEIEYNLNKETRR